MKTRLSEEDFKNCLHRVLQGETMTKVALSVGYGLPFFSTKMKETASKLNLTADLSLALEKQKALRNKSKIVLGEGKLYVKARENTVKEWKPYINGYEVSDNGLIRRNNKIISPSIKKKGLTKYAYVSLSINGKKCYESIHRILLNTFLPKEGSINYQVDHIDGDGLNNTISNLRWVSPSENIKHSFDIHETIKKGVCSKGGLCGGAKRHDKAIIKYTTMLGNRLISFNKSRNSTITYKCKICGCTKEEPITARAFRHGANGICGSCRRLQEK